MILDDTARDVPGAKRQVMVRCVFVDNSVDGRQQRETATDAPVQSMIS